MSMFRSDTNDSRSGYDFDSSVRSFVPELNKSFASTTSSTAGLGGIAMAQNGAGSAASSSKAVLAALRALQDKIRRLETEKSVALDEAAALRTQLKSLEIDQEHSRERDALHNQKLLQDARMAYEKILSEKTEMENRLRILDKQLDKVNGELQSAVRENKELENSKKASNEKLQQMENQVIEMELKLQESLQKEQELSSAMVWETRRHDEEIQLLKNRIESLTSEASIASMQRVERESKLVELDHLIGQLLGVNETLVNQLSQRGIAPAVTTRGDRPTKTAGTKKKRSLSAPKLQPNPDPPAAVAVTKVTRTKKVASKDTNAPTFNARSGSASATGGLHDMHEMYVNLAKQITGKDSTSPGKKKRITSMKQRALKGKTAALSSLDDQSYSSSAMDPIPRNGSRTSYSPPPSSPSDLKGVIQSLEEEFEALNRQYQLLLQPKLGLSSGLGQEERSRELVSVIQRLHKKGEQLRALKSSPQKG